MEQKKCLNLCILLTLAVSSQLSLHGMDMDTDDNIELTEAHADDSDRSSITDLSAAAADSLETHRIEQGERRANKYCECFCKCYGAIKICLIISFPFAFVSRLACSIYNNNQKTDCLIVTCNGMNTTHVCQTQEELLRNAISSRPNVTISDSTQCWKDNCQASAYCGFFAGQSCDDQLPACTQNIESLVTLIEQSCYNNSARANTQPQNILTQLQAKSALKNKTAKQKQQSNNSRSNGGRNINKLIKPKYKGR